LIETLDDPAATIKAIDAAIRVYELRESELEHGVGPVLRALDDVAEEMRRLDLAFVRGNIEESDLLKLGADAEERRRSLEAQRDAYGPDVLNELVKTRRLIKGAQDLRAVAGRRAKNSDPMSLFSFSAEYAESAELVELREAGGPLAALSNGRDNAEVLSDILSQLHAEIFIFKDRLEIRGFIPLIVRIPRQPDSGDDSRSTSRSPRGPG
jgi:hypothetical protein